MFTVQSSKNNDSWSRTDAGDIVSKDNIDSFIPKFDTDSARAELENLQNIQNKINETKGSWDDYNNKFQNGRKYLLEYAKSNNVLESSVDNVKEANQKAREAAIAHNAALKQQTLSAKAATVVTKAFAIAGNMIAFALISKGVELVVEKFDNWIHRAKKAKEASDELFTTLESAQSALSAQRDLLERVDKSFEKYSSGVDSLGRNISLTEEEFEDYHDICNEIAKYYPNMITAWTKEGDAVVDLKDKVNDLKVAYEEEKTSALNAFVSNSGDIVDSYNLNADYSAKHGLDKTSGYKQQIAALKAYLDVIQNVDISERVNAINGLMKYGGEGFSGFDLQNALRDLDLTKYSLDELPSYLSGVIKNLQTQLSTQDDSMKQMLIHMFALDSNDYDGISDKAYQLGTSFINSLDSSFFDGKSVGEYRSFVDDLLEGLTGENAKKVSTAISSLLNLDVEKSTLTSEEYEKYLRNLINNLQTYLDMDENEIKLIVGMETNENPEEYVSRLINSVKSKDGQKLTAGSASILSNSLNRDHFNEALEKLSIDELETLNNINDSSFQKFKASLIDDTDVNSVDEYVTAIKKYVDELKKTQNTIDTDKTLSFTDAISQVESLSKGLDQLDKIYADIYDKGDFDWSSILNNNGFEEVFGKFTDEYNNFIETISNSPDDIDACQNAFDKLATAYIYNSDAMKSLTEDTKDATIAMLEQMGIANATEVVEYQLAQSEGGLANAKANLAEICQTLSQSVNSAQEAEYLAQLQSIDLKNATYEGIQALIDEANELGINCNSLIQYKFYKMDANNATINTSADINNLLSLANATGIASSAVSKLAGLKARYDDAVKRNLNGDVGAGYEAVAIANEMEKAANDAKNDVLNFKPVVNYSGVPSTTSAKNNANQSSGSSAKDSTKEETAETFNWIDTKLDALSKKTEMLSDAFSKTFTLNSAQEKYPEYMASIGEEIQANNDAISYYQQKLNEVGLAYEWIAKIQAGAIDISTITDSGLADQIQQYQNYYSQIQSYYDNIKRLEEEREKAQADYAKKVLEAHDLEIESFQKIIDRREALISLKETFGFSASGKDLKTEQDAVGLQINRIEEQNRYLNELIVTTTYGSDAWKTYYDRINDNNDSIIDLTQSLADLAAQIANLPLDKLDAYLEKNASKNELYSAKLDNATTAKNRNKLINKQIKLAKNDNKKAQSTAKTTAQNVTSSIKEFSSAKKTDKKYASNSQKKEIDDYYKKIQERTKSKKKIPASLITQLSEKGYSYLAQAAANYNAALAANETAQTTAELMAETTKSEIAQLTLDKFNNTATGYDNKMSANDQKKTSIQNKISLAEQQGKKVSTAYYRSLISVETANQKKLIDKRDALQKSLDNAVANGSIQKGSDGLMSILWTKKVENLCCFF